MFESKEENVAAVKAGLEIIDRYPRGAEIPVGEFIVAWGCQHRSDRWIFLVKKLRARMRRDTGVVLASKAPGTLSALTDEEMAVWYPQQQWKRRWRSTGRTARALASVNQAKLTTHQRRIFAVTQEKLRAERRMLRQEKNAIKSSYRTPVNPMRKMPVPA